MTDITALAAELTEDELTRGYAGMSDVEVAADINTKYRTRIRDTIAGAEIFNATDDVEYAVLTTDEKAGWDRLCAIAEIDTSSGVAKAREAELFGAGTDTRNNLVAVKTETISRATELGLGTLKPADVQRVRS